MDSSLRIVTQMPMRAVWDSDGNTTTTKLRDLRSEEIRVLLRLGPVRFVIAAPGKQLNRIAPAECYQFWKAEVKPRTVNTDSFDLNEFPGAYCYVASEWEDGQAFPLFY
jgi:hypothetical protein